MKTTIRLYDSYEGKVREFVPLEGNEVDIYYCGPTVYNYVHLGNFRPTITFDLLTRFLKEEGYDVRCVSNYTDIDDKIIRESLKEGKSEKELSQFYIRAYEDCLSELNVLPLYRHPKASEYIEKMVSFIGDLLEKGNAYRGKEDIYFSVKSIPEYGRLSKQRIEDLESGKRIEVDDEKKDPLDFVLWKLTDDEGIKFDTDIGLGRPGWHTECVVMANDVFHKPMIDIHGGGFDLKFPHHENEIAQSEAENGTRLANFWMHVGFLLTDGVKMSKSLGNSILAKDVIARHSGNAVRLFFYQSHYRAPVNYTEENLASAKKATEKYHLALLRGRRRLEIQGVEAGDLLEEDYRAFLEALSDDLNVANALTIVDKEVKMLNALLQKKESDLSQIGPLVATLTRFFDILGFSFPIEPLTESDRKDYQDYLEARERKDFATSDLLRSRLMEKGLL